MEVSDESHVVAALLTREAVPQYPINRRLMLPRADLDILKKSRKSLVCATNQTPDCPGKVVKCTLVQALRVCTGRTAHRGSRGIALPFHDHGTRRGWGVSVTPRLLFTSGKDPVPIVQEAWWAPVLVWTGAENLASTGIQSPDRPARSQSLYRLRFPAHQIVQPSM